MDNLIRQDISDKGSLVKAISERENIICKYRATGFLDRKDAIEKIQELRINDEDVAKVTSVKLATYSILFSQSTNDQIVGELIMQRDILKAKLAEKQVGEHTRGLIYN